MLRLLGDAVSHIVAFGVLAGDFAVGGLVFRDAQAVVACVGVEVLIRVVRVVWVFVGVHRHGRLVVRHGHSDGGRLRRAAIALRGVGELHFTFNTRIGREDELAAFEFDLALIDGDGLAFGNFLARYMGDDGVVTLELVVAQHINGHWRDEGGVGAVIKGVLLWRCADVDGGGGAAAVAVVNGDGEAVIAVVVRVRRVAVLTGVGVEHQGAVLRLLGDAVSQLITIRVLPQNLTFGGAIFLGTQLVIAALGVKALFRIGGVGCARIWVNRVRRLIALGLIVFKQL